MLIKLLDLYCKAGGCSKGYFEAAIKLGYKIHITGVDIEEQPNYPYKFIKADAVKFFKKNYQKFTHIHASPPCQKYSCSTSHFRNKGKIYRDSLEEIKSLMYESGLPGVIENVPNAPIRPDIVLRGDIFGLKVLRKRHFELVNWFDFRPLLPTKKGTVKEGDFLSVFGNANLQTGCKRLKGFENATIKESWKYAMGIDWMKTDRELAEAIPPHYTEYIAFNFFKQKALLSLEVESM